MNLKKWILLGLHHLTTHGGLNIEIEVVFNQMWAIEKLAADKKTVLRKSGSHMALYFMGVSQKTQKSTIQRY